MAWSQKDDGSWTDPKLCALSDRAYRLNDCCWTYAADKLTDGRITREEVARVASMFNLTDRRELTKAINELLTSRLWKEDTTAYTMVDWITQNRSRKQVLHSRDLNRQKQARWRQQKDEK